MFETYSNKKPLYGLRKFQRTAHYCNENRDDKIEFLTQTLNNFSLKQDTRILTPTSFLSVHTYAFLL